MSAGRYNYTIEAGATFSRTITYTDPEDTPIDLSGSVIRMQIRDNYSSEEAAISVSTTDGGIVLTGDPGVFVLTLTPELTGSIPFRQGVYDIEIEYADQTVERVLEGRVKISTQVTQ